MLYRINIESSEDFIDEPEICTISLLSLQTRRWILQWSPWSWLILEKGSHQKIAKIKRYKQPFNSDWTSSEEVREKSKMHLWSHTFIWLSSPFKKLQSALADKEKEKQPKTLNWINDRRSSARAYHSGTRNK